MTRTDPQQINQSIVFDSCYVIIQLHITAHRNKKKDKSSAAENSAAEAIFRYFARRKANAHAQTKDFSANLRSRFGMD